MFGRATSFALIVLVTVPTFATPSHAEPGFIQQIKEDVKQLKAKRKAKSEGKPPPQSQPTTNPPATAPSQPAQQQPSSVGYKTEEGTKPIYESPKVATPAASTAKGDLQIMLKKPGGGIKVGTLSSVQLCPALLSGEGYLAQRVVGWDGSVFGVVKQGTTTEIKHCKNGKFDWTHKIHASAWSRIDSWGSVYAVSDTRGQPGKKTLHAIKPNGKSSWATVLESDKNLYISVRPQPSTLGIVYVFGTTEGVLKGQPSSTKGKRFVTKFDAKGKALWTTHVDADRGALFDVDAKGNVHVLAYDEKTLGRLTQLDPSGKITSRRTLRLKKGSVPFRVEGLHVDAKSSDLYLIASSFDVPDVYGIIKINADGKLGWARAIRLSRMGGGAEEEFVGAGVRGDTLHVFRIYGWEEEGLEGFPANQFEMHAMAFRVADGRPKWVRAQWFSGFDISETQLLGDVFILPGKIAMPSSAITSFKVGADGKPMLPGQPAALPPPKGDYTFGHKISVYEDGEESIEETADWMRIKPAPNHGLAVKIWANGNSYSECHFQATLSSIGTNQWQYSSSSSTCVVTLTHTKKEITVESTSDCDQEWCGHGSAIDGTYPTADRKPSGTFDWPQL